LPDVHETSATRFHILHLAKSYRIEIIAINKEEKTIELKVNNRFHLVKLKDKFDDLLKSLGMESSGPAVHKDVKAPMPGLVLQVLVEAGQQVDKDSPLVVLEAMKMENVIKSPASGTVKIIRVQKGIAVEKNAVLVEFF